MRPEYWVLCENCGHNGDYKFNKAKAKRDARLHAEGMKHIVMIYRKDLVLDEAINPAGEVAQHRLF